MGPAEGQEEGAVGEPPAPSGPVEGVLVVAHLDRRAGRDRATGVAVHAVRGEVAGRETTKPTLKESCIN